MSVTTRVDELIDSTKEHIKQAIKDLHEALDEETWGNSELSAEYINTMSNAQANLRDMKSKL